MSLRKNLGEDYSPTLFLASLGNGGLAVSFYIYLHFMVKHLNLTFTRSGEELTSRVPMATFDALWPVITGDNLFHSILVILGMAGIVFFAVRHYFFLVWNFQELGRFKQTAAWGPFMNSNKEISLSSIPLTLAMSINVAFVIGGVFVPGLWTKVEYLFPGALLAFLAVGIYAIRIFMVFMSRNLTTGEFDSQTNNSLGQMIAAFAFSMVAVGFAAPGAMSTNPLTSALGIAGSMFFLSAAVLFGLQGLFFGVRSMLDHGINREHSPTLWILIPIMTLIGIAVVRIDHGLHTNLAVHTQPGEMFVSLVFLLSVQILFALMGWSVMKKVGYFEEFVKGSQSSHTSYALICPGVAIFVFGMFVLHHGFVKVGVFDKFSIPYFIVVAILAYIQLKTILMVFKLDRKVLFTK